MSGKKGAPTPPPVAEAPPDNSQLIMAMMQMLSAQSYAPPDIPDIPSAPDVETPESIDWAEKTKQLAAKVKADYQNDNTRKRGSTSTILTSPLLDEEIQNSSLIGG